MFGRLILGNGIHKLKNVSVTFQFVCEENNNIGEKLYGDQLTWSICLQVWFETSSLSIYSDVFCRMSSLPGNG
jgi:hypothetical protein